MLPGSSLFHRHLPTSSQPSGRHTRESSFPPFLLSQDRIKGLKWWFFFDSSTSQLRSHQLALPECSLPTNLPIWYHGYCQMKSKERWCEDYSGSQLAGAGEPEMQLAMSQCSAELGQFEGFIDLTEVSQSPWPHASPFIPLKHPSVSSLS